MEFNEYQSKAWETAIYPGKGNNIYYPALGLAGEAGEICNVIKKIIRDDGGKITSEVADKLKKEIGDAQWYISALANELSISLNDIVETNIEKLNSRKQRGVLQGSGDNR